ncbi:MAG TPA: hypothetical protein VHR66_01865 [Gemmataceae bacterium]|nr:hypothetical protein [Gemmataceae bacterium]
MKVSVFANRVKTAAQEMTFHKSVIQRVCREGEEWKTTTSLSRDDIPLARMLLERAWEWILEAESGAASRDSISTAESNGSSEQAGESIREPRADTRTPGRPGTRSRPARENEQTRSESAPRSEGTMSSTSGSAGGT